jgi:superfamily II RNA helicase
MEKEYKESINEQKSTEHKNIKKKKSVNWDNVKSEDKNSEQSEKEKKSEIKDLNQNDKELLEIEVIKDDGSIIKEQVNYEKKESEEFIKKREEKSHNEYTIAKEFVELHNNEDLLK